MNAKEQAAFDEQQARIANLLAQLEAASVPKVDATGLTFKITDKGALSVYGIGGRFPAQFHPDQWAVIFSNREKIEQVLQANADKLVTVASILANYVRKGKPSTSVNATVPTIASTAVDRAAATMAARDAAEQNHEG
jgi:hypothetical protein